MNNQNGDRFTNIKNLLDDVSPSFCLAKWHQVTILLHNGHNHSCHHPITHKIPLEEIKDNPSALHNTNHKKKRRKLMLEGVRPPECHYCWDIEDASPNNISDRLIKSSDPWSPVETIPEVVEKGHEDNVIPRYVELSFSNTCNLKCSYCKPTLSSSWMSEIRQHGFYELTYGRFQDFHGLYRRKELPLEDRENNPYIDAFWKWWPELSKELQVLRVTGGEPLLDRNTFKLMEKLTFEEHSVNHFSINTNFMPPDEQINKMISALNELLESKKVDDVSLYTSVDTFGEQAEFIRTGLEYDKWLTNIIKTLMHLPDLKITIMCTTNLFSLSTMKKMLQDIEDVKKYFRTKSNKNPVIMNFTLLTRPIFQSLFILDADENDPILDHLRECLIYIKSSNYFTHFEELSLERVIRTVEQKNTIFPKHELEEHQADFYAFINEYERRRNLDFFALFPELKDFYYLCKEKYIHLQLYSEREQITDDIRRILKY